jgi:ferredoxin
MKVIVDEEECIGAAMCTGLAPTVFDLSEDGLVALLDENPPEKLRARVKQAVTSCPVSAIRIQD